MFTGRERRQSKACSFFVLRPSELWAGAVHASLPLRYPAVSLLSFSGSGHRLHIQARRLTHSHGLFGYLAALCRGVEVSVELQVTVVQYLSTHTADSFGALYRALGSSDVRGTLRFRFLSVFGLHAATRVVSAHFPVGDPSFRVRFGHLSDCELPF